MLTDEDIIQGCKKGDRRAQEALFQCYGKKMYGYCLRYSGNPADANDLLQDGFVKVFEFIGTFKGDSAIEAWMTRLFINLAISRFRKRGTGPQFVEVDSIPLAEQAEEKEDVQETLRQSVDEVLSALAALPEKYRLVINLYAIDNLSHREIAEQLGISEGGSKSLLSRGRAMLKEILDNKNKR
ncbi:MAG: RNA polymerase sigma factor [Sphingomonadales bacterium]|nr:RNA polymerase sigma factor [Sphingomonadales bacterium]